MVEIVKDGIHRKVDESRLPDWKAKGYTPVKATEQKEPKKPEKTPEQK